MSMGFIWNIEKSQECLDKRGFDFDYASKVFFDPNRYEWEDKRSNYGEVRYKTIGMIDGRFFMVVFTLRDSNIRIISAWKAKNREIRKYGYNAIEG